MFRPIIVDALRKSTIQIGAAHPTVINMYSSMILDAYDLPTGVVVFVAGKSKRCVGPRAIVNILMLLKILAKNA